MERNGNGNMVRKEKVFIFTIIWRWATATEGEGVIRLENGELPYFPQIFTLIPKNCPHAIQGEEGELDYWEFLFIDMERFLLDLYPGRNRLVEEICRRINRGARLLTYEKNPVLGDLVQEILREMKGKGEFYQESVKGYLLAFLMEIGPAGWRSGWFSGFG